MPNLTRIHDLTSIGESRNLILSTVQGWMAFDGSAASSIGCNSTCTHLVSIEAKTRHILEQYCLHLQ
jgi:hypothetical protein